MKKIIFIATMVCGLVVSAMLFSGCASPDLKGTPYYTDDAGFDKGSSDDRVPLWPIVYYKNPALSVLWPFIEKTDEYFAFRPFISAYGLSGDKQVYSFLWPIAEFDRTSNDNRIFPIFWGTDYFTAFPFYWHSGHPNGLQGGTDTFFPAWYYSRNASGSDTYILWPLIHLKNKNGAKGWHVWPFVGHYWTAQNSYSFAFWPLGHQWSNLAGDQGNALLPLCWYDGDSRSSLFLSPIFSCNRIAGSDDGWNLVLPLFYSEKGGENHFRATLLGGYSSSPSGVSWVAIPLLSCGEKSGDSLDLSIVWPLSHFQSDDNGAWRYVFPLFYNSVDKHKSLFLSVPWSSGRNADGSWQLLPPLFYAEQKGNNDRMACTLLGDYHERSDGLSWMAVPALSGGWSGKDGSEVWIGGALAHFKSAASSSSQHIFPLYYRGSDRSGSLFISLPFSSASSSDGAGWRLAPPLFYGYHDMNNSGLITPLYAQGENKASDTRWNTVVPLYYRTTSSNSSTIATLLGGVRKDEDGKSWLIYPLLSGGKRDKGSGDIWIAAPMFHAGWDKNGSSQHLLPLYYWNSESQMFLSLLAARWKDADNGNRITAVPPLVSWMESDGKTTDLWAIAGLMHLSWGEKPGSQHVLPLFYRDASSGTLISPVAAKWRGDDGATNYMFPPALSWLTRAPDRNDLWMVGPMAHWSWGPKAGSSHVIPLFYNNSVSGTFLSLPLCAWKDGNTRTWICPPLLSEYANDGADRDLYGVLGLFHQRWGGSGVSGHLMPLYLYGHRYFYSPVFGWDKSDEDGFVYPLTPIAGLLTGERRSGCWLFPLFCHQREKATGDIAGRFLLWGYYDSNKECGDSGFFPFWWYSRNEISQKGILTAHGSVLFWLFDYLREFNRGDIGIAKDYTRSRVLWRLYCCEKSEGNVSVDMFPAITYDRRTDGFKKVSFLWRFFRYERGKDGTKLDLLFVPVMRTTAKEGAI